MARLAHRQQFGGLDLSMLAKLKEKGISSNDTAVKGLTLQLHVSAAAPLSCIHQNTGFATMPTSGHWCRPIRHSETLDAMD